MDTNKPEAKQEVDDTTNQPAPTEEKNDGQKTPAQEDKGQEEQVTLSKKELETLKKKAEDFERSIELKRLAKLKPEDTEKKEDVSDEINALKEKLSSLEAKSYNDSLAEAYRAFTSEHPWLNDDVRFEKIKENFVTAGTETKDELLAKFKVAAQTAFPTEYEKHLEDKMLAKAMSLKKDIPEGGGANSATTIHTDNKPKTEEELRKERLGSLLKQNLTWIKQ